jgi:hypothetical protein
LVKERVPVGWGCIGFEVRAGGNEIRTVVGEWGAFLGSIAIRRNEGNVAACSVLIYAPQTVEPKSIVRFFARSVHFLPYWVSETSSWPRCRQSH